MNELHFTWITGIKLFTGLLIFGVWLLTRQEAKMDENEKKIQSEARAKGGSEPARRIVSRSNYIIVAAAIVYLIIVLVWGNESTI